MTKEAWHVYIAQGSTCASADFMVDADSPVAAKLAIKNRAAELWNVPVGNLNAHQSKDCDKRGCNGRY